MSVASGEIELVRVSSRGQLREFVRLPYSLYSAFPKWVGPLIADDLRRLDRRHNTAFSYCDTLTLLAYRGGRAVGRILGIINHRHGELVGERVVRFSHLDSIDDPRVTRSLLEHVERWGSDRSCGRAVGPMGFSDQDPEGLLVEGFDHEPSLATLHNPAYLRDHIEEAGYEKEVDYVTYTARTVVPERVNRVATRLLDKSQYRLIEFRRRSEMKKEARPMLELLNETYRGLYGFVPLSEIEMADLARRYIPLLDPRFVKLVRRQSELVGFMVGVPNFAEGLRRAAGRLYPFGFFHILRSMRRSQRLDLLLGGIREDCRARGVDAILGVAMFSAALRAGLTTVDSHHVLETNRRMRAECEKWGGTIYKRHRIYRKAL
jgi:hypothetical protein